jgi:hypothetical protein
MNLQEVEAVARALYEIQVEARSWERESERLKVRFRQEARTAIAALDKHDRQTRTSQNSAQLHGLTVSSTKPHRPH